MNPASQRSDYITSTHRELSGLHRHADMAGLPSSHCPGTSIYEYGLSGSTHRRRMQDITASQRAKVHLITIDVFMID